MKRLELLVSPVSVADAALDMASIDGVSLELPTCDRPVPSKSKSHGSYIADFPELIPVVVGLASSMSSLLAFASAVLNYQSAVARKSQPGHETSGKHGPIIRIESTNLIVSQFSTPQELANVIAEHFQAATPKGSDETAPPAQQENAADRKPPGQAES